MQLLSQLSQYLASQDLILNNFQEDLLNQIDNNLENILIVAPTGIGKTLVASLLVLNDWLLINDNRSTRTPKKFDKLAIWISPLKALSRNLVQQLERYWTPLWEDRPSKMFATKSAVDDRTGDTNASERQQLLKNPPFILCTTPESLFSLVIQKTARKAMSSIKYVIVDELHSLAESKRGVLLSLTLEALERISDEPLIRIGLSATVANLDWMSQFLVGPIRTVTIFNEVRFDRTPDLILATRVIRKGKNLLPAFGYGGGWLAETIVGLLSMDRTVLIFTTTRSATERIVVNLKSLVSEEFALRIAAHHSALSMEERFFVEKGLRHGYLKVVSATASLELGVDIGSIDEVLIIASPGSTNRALQRIGRARHNPNERPKGQIFATNYYDFLVAISLYRQILAKQYSPVSPPVAPLDVLAQFIFGLAIQRPFTKSELEKILKNTLLFQDVSSQELDNCLIYCIQGGKSLGAYDEYKRIKVENQLYKINSPRFQRLFYQNIGTIVEEDMIPVVSEKGGRKGSLEEVTAKKLEKGDIIALGGKSFRVEGFRKGQVVVKKSSRSPTVLRWGKTRIPMSEELLQGMKTLYKEIESNSGYLADDWFNQDHTEIIQQLYHLQTVVVPWPTAQTIQIEFYDLSKFPKYFRFRRLSYPYLVVIYTFAGLQANHTLSRLISHRLENYLMKIPIKIHTDELAFGLFSNDQFPHEIEAWEKLVSIQNASDEISDVVERSHALRIAFRETALLGQMILRTYYKLRKTGRQLRLSHDLLFDVLQKHEPDHPLLEAARQQVSTQFLHVPKAIEWLSTNNNKPIKLVNPKIAPPLTLPVLVHGWIDWSVPSDPYEALEAIYEKVMAEYEHKQ